MSAANGAARPTMELTSAAHMLRLAAYLIERYGDRADPSSETVLCLVEAATRAFAGPVGGGQPDEIESQIQQALAGARAAVVCASFALVAARSAGGPPAPRS